MHTYRFALARDRPVLSLAPLCTRMVAAYQDRAGTIHLFTDAYDPMRETAWHMFALQYSLPGDAKPRRYGHFSGPDPLRWELVNDEVLATTSDRPQHGAADICPLWTPFEPGAPKLAFSNRLDDGTYGDSGVYKQWLWKVSERP